MSGDWRFWALILALGMLTYLMRLSFMLLMRRHEPPARLIRMLRFVPVTVLPALVAPLIVFPASEGGAFSPLRLLAAGAALMAGAMLRSMLGAILAGGAVFWIGRALL